MRFGFHRGLYGLIYAFEPDEFEQLAGFFRNVFEVLSIPRRQHDTLDAGSVSGNDFLLDPADGEYEPAQADLAGHSGVVAHIPLGQQRDERHKHGDARARSILRSCACWHMNVDIGLLKSTCIDSEGSGTILDDAERRLSAFPHYLAKLAGEDQLPVSRNAGRFDEQDIASDGGPGEAGRHARHARAQRQLAFELRRAKNAKEIVAGDADGTALSFGNADSCVALGFSDLALEVSHARFSGIVLDGFPECVVRDLDLTRLQPVCLHLTSHQVALGDL